MPREWTVRRVDRVDGALVDELTDVLIDCVEGDASVSFMHPLTRERARSFWRHVGDGVAAGERVLFVASDDRSLCGTVQIIFPSSENQPHRADVAKMIVHRRARRRGLGEALMRAAEKTALDLGRTLLVLDTASEDAKRLYERLGWIRVGTIPDYALMPRGGYCDTVVYYRKLA